MKPLSAVVLAGLLGSAGALALAPAILPASYSWWSHTTSEAAAQGVSGGWLSRLGFLLFGAAVGLLAVARRSRLGPAATALHLSFGVAMVAVAIFSARSWLPDAAYDRTEDLLHSIAASLVGFAFALGVFATWWGRGRPVRSLRGWSDLAAVAAAVVFPLAMTVAPAAAGAWQRLMFAVAYAWYAGEAMRRG